MAATKLSTKGQVVLPKEIRDRHGWSTGTRLEIQDLGDRIVLREITDFPATTIDQVFGCAPYDGPAKSLEEMEEAIAIGARRHR
jgi:AbrB family looped-hinge helix DNA binding protein